MNATVNDPGSLANDSEGEIKKLQELVKKLELQNQLLLRHNSQDEKIGGCLQPLPEQFLESGNSNFAQFELQNQQMTGKLDQSSQVLRQLNGIKTPLANNTISMTPEKPNKDKSERSKVELSRLSLESVGLVDIDRLSLDVEDSWLYKSPKQTPGTETTKSPFLWLREEFDQPMDDHMSSFHKSLYYKLDEVTKHDPGSLYQQKKPDIKNSEGADVEHNPDFIPDNGDVIDIIGVAPLGKPVDSRPSASQADARCMKNDTADSGIFTKGTETLIRPSALIGKDRRVSESSIADTGYQKVSSASEENLLGVKYRLTDVTDVKLLAKMQEESLRMSYNSPLGSKKALSKSLNRSSGRLVDSCDSLLSDHGGFSKGLNQSTGALLETVDYSADSKPKRACPQKLMNENRNVSKSATSLAVPASRAAACSGLPKAQVASNSLPGTPYSSNQELSKPTLSTASNVVPYRQSLPNLNRNLKFSVLKSHPSESRLAATGKKPLSLLRQSSPSSASSTTLGRGLRTTTPVKATANALQRPATRGTNAVNSSAVPPVSLSLKNRPTTLASSEVRATRVMTSGSGRTSGATTPTSKAKPLVMSAKKITVTTPPRSAIPKPGSLTKLSIPQKTNVQKVQSTSTPINDEDDWKEGCF